MSGQNAPKRRAARLESSTLLVDGRPMFPRIVQHRGEPLKKLQKLGFNAVWLEHAPAPEVLEEAVQLGLWLICPPPRPKFDDPQGVRSVADPRAADWAGVPPRSADGLLVSAPAIEIGPAFDCVLAWSLGTDLTSNELEATRRWAEQVHTADRRNPRPLICRSTSNLRSFSRLADLLLIDRRPLGTSLDLVDYGEWVCKQPRLALPGTSVWTTVQTQPTESLRQQLGMLEPNGAPPTCVSPEQIRLLAYTAIASGSRGLLFLSDTPLDALDPATRQRAMALELLNLEIELMEPWAAAGKLEATARSDTRQVTCSVLRAECAYLLLPIWSSAGSQCATPEAAVKNLSLVVPGVPDTSSVYAITPGGIQELRRQRVTGGMHVTIKEFDLTAQILVAHDPKLICDIQRRAVEIGKRAADLQRQLAAMKWSKVQAVAQTLARPSPVRQVPAWLEYAGSSLHLSDAQFAAGDLTNATWNAQRASRALRMVERAHWDAAVKHLMSPVTTPTSLCFETLPQHFRLIDRIQASPRGPNVLFGGDFEDPESVRRAWRPIQPATPGVQSAADFVPDAAHSGRLGLRLAAQPDDPEHSPVVVEMAPIMYATPSVPVEAGQIVCIHGWVNVPRSITGNVDGLLIIDSLTMDALANRVQRTDGWKEFAMYRVVPQAGTLSVIFALSGLGEAQIDDVAIEILQGSANITQR